jgi:hypothetical protein
VNTIVKRLGEIKKRNGLNIVTTSSAPGSPPGGKPTNSGAGETKPKPKREKGSKSAKTAAPVDNGVKTEAHPSAAMYSLPSPADSTPDTPTPAPTSSFATAWPLASNATMSPSTSEYVKTEIAAAPMTFYATQKRSREEMEGSDHTNHVVKKAKTETWGFN